MHSMCPPNHRRVAMLVGAYPNGLEQAIEAAQDQIAGVAHLQCLSCVDHVRGGQTEMKPAR